VIIAAEFPQYRFFYENVAWTNETKYLGVILDSKLAYKTHISYVLRKDNCRLRQLFPIINKSSTMNVNLAVTVYKSFLESILTYAPPAWGYDAESYININYRYFKIKSSG
jgi:hypothetical protein